MIGKNVAAGVTGGCAPINGDVYGAADIDADTGRAAPNGGSIGRGDTNVAAAKTLGVALGIEPAALQADFTDNGSIAYVKGSLNGVG